MPYIGEIKRSNQQKFVLILAYAIKKIAILAAGSQGDEDLEGREQAAGDAVQTHLGKVQADETGRDKFRCSNFFYRILILPML